MTSLAKELISGVENYQRNDQSSQYHEIRRALRRAAEKGKLGIQLNQQFDDRVRQLLAGDGIATAQFKHKPDCICRAGPVPSRHMEFVLLAGVEVNKNCSKEFYDEIPLSDE